MLLSNELRAAPPPSCAAPYPHIYNVRPLHCLPTQFCLSYPPTTTPLHCQYTTQYTTVQYTVPAAAATEAADANKHPIAARLPQQQALNPPPLVQASGSGQGGSGALRCDALLVDVGGTLLETSDPVPRGVRPIRGEARSAAVLPAVQPCGRRSLAPSQRSCRLISNCPLASSVCVSHFTGSKAAKVQIPYFAKSSGSVLCVFAPGVVVSEDRIKAGFREAFSKPWPKRLRSRTQPPHVPRGFPTQG